MDKYIVLWFSTKEHSGDFRVVWVTRRKENKWFWLCNSQKTEPPKRWATLYLKHQSRGVVDRAVINTQGSKALWFYWSTFPLALCIYRITIWIYDTHNMRYMMIIWVILWPTSSFCCRIWSLLLSRTLMAEVALKRLKLHFIDCQWKVTYCKTTHSVFFSHMLTTADRSCVHCLSDDLRLLSALFWSPPAT